MARRRADDTERSLRAAIAASPDDDAPRLVYADWLTERGDPRGELIQIQCMLGRPLNGRGKPAHPNHATRRNVVEPSLDPAVRKPLELREKALLRDHQKSWLAPIRSYINSWFWQRGFVSRVDINIGKLVTHLAELLDFTPLRAAYVTGCTTALVRKLSETPLIAAVPCLSFDQQRIGARELESFRSPSYAKLQELSLQLDPLDDEAMKVLASSTTLGELRVLDLSFSEFRITTTGVESLSHAPFFPRLTHLDLTYSLADKTVIEPILKRGTGLEWLSLGNQKITKQEAELRAARGLDEPD